MVKLNKHMLRCVHTIGSIYFQNLVVSNVTNTLTRKIIFLLIFISI